MTNEIGIRFMGKDAVPGEDITLVGDGGELPFVMSKICFDEKGAPIYPIQRMNMVTEEPFNDGEHILYVNGEYRGEDDLGKLINARRTLSPLGES